MVVVVVMLLGGDGGDDGLMMVMVYSIIFSPERPYHNKNVRKVVMTVDACIQLGDDDGVDDGCGDDGSGALMIVVMWCWWA